MKSSVSQPLTHTAQTIKNSSVNDLDLDRFFMRKQNYPIAKKRLEDLVADEVLLEKNQKLVKLLITLIKPQDLNGVLGEKLLSVSQKLHEIGVFRFNEKSLVDVDLNVMWLVSEEIRNRFKCQDNPIMNSYVYLLVLKEEYSSDAIKIITKYIELRNPERCLKDALKAINSNSQIYLLNEIIRLSQALKLNGFEEKFNKALKKCQLDLLGEKISEAQARKVRVSLLTFLGGSKEDAKKGETCGFDTLIKKVNCYLNGPREDARDISIDCVEDLDAYLDDPTSIKGVELRGNEVKEGYLELERLASYFPLINFLKLNLTHFQVESTNSFLQCFKQLERLSVTLFTDLKHLLTHLPNIKFLTVRNSRISCRDFEKVAQLSKLEELDLRETGFDKDVNWSKLLELQKLKTLKLSLKRIVEMDHFPTHILETLCKQGIEVELDGSGLDFGKQYANPNVVTELWKYAERTGNRALQILFNKKLNGISFLLEKSDDLKALSRLCTFEESSFRSLSILLNGKNDLDSIDEVLEMIIQENWLFGCLEINFIFKNSDEFLRQRVFDKIKKIEALKNLTVKFFNENVDFISDLDISDFKKMFPKSRDSLIKEQSCCEIPSYFLQMELKPKKFFRRHGMNSVAISKTESSVPIEDLIPELTDCKSLELKDFVVDKALLKKLVNLRELEKLDVSRCQIKVPFHLFFKFPALKSLSLPLLSNKDAFLNTCLKLLGGNDIKKEIENYLVSQEEQASHSLKIELGMSAFIKCAYALLGLRKDAKDITISSKEDLDACCADPKGVKSVTWGKWWRYTFDKERMNRLKQHCSSLRGLSLQVRALEEIDEDVTDGFPCLKEVTIRQSKSSVSLEDQIQKLKNCRSIKLEKFLIGKELLEKLASLPKLKKIDISMCKLEAPFYLFYKFPCLKKLSLPQINFDYRIMQPLAHSGVSIHLQPSQKWGFRQKMVEIDADLKEIHEELEKVILANINEETCISYLECAKKLQMENLFFVSNYYDMRQRGVLDPRKIQFPDSFDPSLKENFPALKHEDGRVVIIINPEDLDAYLDYPKSVKNVQLIANYQTLDRLASHFPLVKSLTFLNQSKTYCINKYLKRFNNLDSISFETSFWIEENLQNLNNIKFLTVRSGYFDLLDFKAVAQLPLLEELDLKGVEFSRSVKNLRDPGNLKVLKLNLKQLLESNHFPIPFLNHLYDQGVLVDIDVSSLELSKEDVDSQRVEELLGYAEDTKNKCLSAAVTAFK